MLISLTDDYNYTGILLWEGPIYTYGVCGNNVPLCSPCEVVQIVEVQWETIRWRSIQSSRVDSVISLEDGATGGQLAQLHASKEEDIFPHCQWTVEKQ